MSDAPDMKAMTQAQQRTWSEGDFAMVASLVVNPAETLTEALEIVPDERVLDVACGSGNTTIAASRRFADCVGVDYVPALLERARERAAAERLEIEFREGDAEALPFPDASFDVVLSTFGAMFAPDQPRTAAELRRVCRSGGRIGMANWTPEGFVGQMFAIVAKHAPPVKLDPPPLWGTEARLRELFDGGVSALEVHERVGTMRFHTPEDWLQYFRTWFGPTKVAFARVGPEGEQALADDLLGLVDRLNRGAGGVMVCPSTYLEVVATRA
jgi:SAM-dependent methyltransferase